MNNKARLKASPLETHANSIGPSAVKEEVTRRLIINSPPLCKLQDTERRGGT